MNRSQEPTTTDLSLEPALPHPPPLPDCAVVKIIFTLLPKKFVIRHSSSSNKMIGFSKHQKRRRHPEEGWRQGCQIFLGTWYQNWRKCTKLIQNEPNGHKLSQIFIKYSKWP
jgi:hypothetical protein